MSLFDDEMSGLKSLLDVRNSPPLQKSPVHPEGSIHQNSLLHEKSPPRRMSWNEPVVP